MDKILEEFKNMEKFVEMRNKLEEMKKSIKEKEKDIQVLNEKRYLSSAPLERDYIEDQYNKEKEALNTLEEDEKKSYEKMSASFEKQKEKMIAEIDNEIEKYLETEKNKKAEMLQKTENEKNVHNKIALRSKNEVDKIIAKINDGTNSLDDLKRLGAVQEEYKANTQKVADLEQKIEDIKNAVLKPSERYMDLYYLKSRIQVKNLDNIKEIKEDQFLKKYSEKEKAEKETKNKAENAEKETKNKAENEKGENATKGKEEKMIFNFDKNPLNGKNEIDEKATKNEDQNEKGENATKGKEEKMIFNFDKNPLNGKNEIDEKAMKNEDQNEKGENAAKGKEEKMIFNFDKNLLNGKNEIDEKATKNEVKNEKGENTSKNEKQQDNSTTKSNLQQNIGKIIGIEIIEGSDKINIARVGEDGQIQNETIENKLKEILKNKKEIFKNPEVAKIIDEIEPSRFKQIFLKRKLSPVILNVLSKNKQGLGMIDYVVAIKREENCENLKIKHDLSNTVLKGRLKRMMKRVAKTEHYIDGMEVKGLKETKTMGLLESGKRKLKNKPVTIKEGFKLVGKPFKAIGKETKNKFRKNIEVEKSIKDKLKAVSKSFEDEDLEKLEDKEDPDLEDPDLEETEPKAQEEEQEI